MRKLRDVLWTLLLLAITVRVLWLAIEPLLPLIIGGLVVVLALGAIYFRTWRW